MTKRILVVEDEEDLSELIVKDLASQGYQVDPFLCTEGLISKIREFLPDLILMDIMLPDGSGPEIVQELLEDSRLKDTPVIFLSGIVSRGNERDNTSEVKVGDRFYKALAKPFTAQELGQEVTRALC